MTARARAVRSGVRRRVRRRAGSPIRGILGPIAYPRAVETMIGIAALLVGIGILWLCFALGVFFFTRTGREGMRIQRMEDERRERVTSDR